MKNERIFFADDLLIARDSFQTLFDAFGKDDGHIIVGIAGSVDEVREKIGYLKQKKKLPTVAILDSKMPSRGDGEKAAEIIREMSPETIIISFSASEEVAPWSDFSMVKVVSGHDLFGFITQLKRK